MVKNKYLYRAVSVLLIILGVCVLINTLLSGFRMPSDYVLTNHIISYRTGFLPRSLVGAVGYLIFGNSWYSWKYMSAVIIFTALIFVAWLVVLLIKSGYDFENTMIFFVIFLFAISPYSRFYLHEMGYYEQYGYVLLIVLIYVCKNKNDCWGRYIIPAVLALVSLIISETNMFLIIPVIFSYSFISIISENDKINAKAIKEIAILFATYIPSIIYCIFIWVIKIPVERIFMIQNYDREMVNGISNNFYFREDVHLYMAGDRSNAAIWGHMLHPIHLWCVAMTLLLILFVACAIYDNKRDKKLVIGYSVCAVLSGIAAYSIVLIAWDLERYYFNIFMSVLFISIFVLKKFEIKNFVNKKNIILYFVILAAFVLMSGNRFGLFDGATYNTTVHEFIDSVNARVK